MGVALSLDLDLAKFHKSCFHFSIFRWLDLQGNDAVIRVYDESGNLIDTHEHAGDTVLSIKTPAYRRLYVLCFIGFIIGLSWVLDYGFIGHQTQRPEVPLNVTPQDGNSGEFGYRIFIDKTD
jgi:hypothetical protein